MEKTFKKETENLKKQLHNHLPYFEKNVEWADYSNWLIRLKQIFTDNLTPFIPEKEILAKRLAQCLYPSLPAKVHGEALSVYSKIFESLKLSESNNKKEKYVSSLSKDLSLYALGLFPFFQNASLQIKPQFLKLIQDHFVELQIQLIPCLPSLIACIMPGIETNDEEVQKLTTHLLDLLQDGVGEKYFFSAIWMNILRIPPIRFACFKYLKKKSLPFKELLDKEEEEKKEEKAELKEEIQNDNKNQKNLILHPEDQTEKIENEFSSQIRRDKQDSEFSLCSENSLENSSSQEGVNGIVNNSEKLQNPLKTIKKQLVNELSQFIFFNLIDRYLLFFEDSIKKVRSEENYYPNKESLIINALLSVLQDENQLSRRAGLDYITSHFKIGEDTLDDNEKQLLVQQCIHMFHLNEYNIIRRINTWLFGLPDQENKFTVQENQSGEKILSFIETAIINLFTISETEKVVPLKVVQNFYREHDHFIRPTLEKISYEMVKFMINLKGDPQLLISIERLLQSISNHTDLVLNRLGKKLIEAMEQSDEDKTIEAAELIEFILTLQKKDKEANIDCPQISDSIKPIIHEILNHFAKIGPKSICMRKYRIIALNLVQMLILELLTKPMVEEVKPDEKEAIDNFNSYFCQYINLILIEGEDYQILDSTIKVLIKLNCTIYSNQDSCKLEGSPLWLSSILLCLTPNSPTRIQYISVKNIYGLIENPNSFRQFIISNNETLLVILHCLYYLLDQEYLSSDEIIAHLLHFNQEFSSIFQEYIEKDLKSSPNKIMEALRRYSKFFNFTNSFYQDNPDLNTGIGISQMLNYISDDNPLIRYAARSWLTDNMNHQFRILDPLICEFTEEYKIAEYSLSDKRSVVFRRQFKPEKFIGFYKLIKLLVNILRDKFISYCFKVDLSLKVIKNLQTVPGLQTQLDLSKTSYAKILIFFSLKLLQGQPENISEKETDFIQKSGSINANFCDFLESIITEISSSDEVMSACDFLLENLLITLSNFLDLRNQVMQTQVLNLFKLLLGKVSVSVKKLSFDQLNFLSQILTSNVCFPILLQGLKSSTTSYVRQTYLKTINSLSYYCSLLILQLNYNKNQPILSSLPASNKTQKNKSKKNPAQLFTNQVIDVIQTYVSLLKAASQNEEQPILQEQYSPPESFSHSRVRIQKLFSVSRQKQLEMNISALYIQESTTIPISLQDQTTILKALNKLMNSFLIHKSKQDDPSAPIEKNGFISIFSSSSSAQLKEPTVAKFEHFYEINCNILDNLPETLSAMLECWPLSNSFQNYIQLSNKGICQYRFDQFCKFNKEFQEEVKKEATKKNFKDSLRNKIIEIVKQLYSQFKVDVVHAIFNLYKNNVDNQWFSDKGEGNLMMSKILDLVISLDITLDELVTVMLRSQLIYSISNFYNQKIVFPKNTFVFNTNIATHEINVLSFAYHLFSIYPIDDAKMKLSYLVDIWIPTNKFIQAFKPTKHSQSLLWLIEFIFMMTQKFSPNEPMLDRSFRKDLRRISKSILQTLSQIAANKISFISVARNPSQENEIKRLSQTNEFHLIGPISPSIYEIYLENPDFMIFIVPQNNGQMEYEQFCLFNSILCYKVLSKISYQLLQNIYLEKNRITKITQEFLIELFKVIEEKKQLSNPIHSLHATQVIHSLLKFNGETLVKELRKNIIEIFNGSVKLLISFHILILKLNQDFLNWDIQNLRYWKEIIDSVSDQSDLFKEFLTRDGLLQMLVTKNQDQTHKIKKLFRVCFIIYSGGIDKYSKKLLDILEVLNEVILNYDDSSTPNLFILILFCFRILILRMSKSTLSDQFRIVWPTILSFLMSIFNKKRKGTCNPNLVLSALKFIEVLSIVQLEEFFFYEWMFAFDYLGVNFQKIKNEDNQLQILLNGGKVVTPFKFQPSLSGFFNNNFSLNYLNQIREGDRQNSCLKEKRKIIISESTVTQQLSFKFKIFLCAQQVENEQELHSKVLSLCQYLIDVNQKRLEVDFDLLEQVIEVDFIELSQFMNEEEKNDYSQNLTTFKF